MSTPTFTTSTTALTSDEECFNRQYAELTKKILLSAIELERFSLNFRMETARQPKFRSIRYVLAQETGASGALAAEMISLKQCDNGRKRPERVNQRSVRQELSTATSTAIIAASSSAFELSSNIVRYIKNRRKGYDHKSALKYVQVKLAQFDELLEQQERLVAANPAHPGHDRSVAEGKVLRAMRDAFINEYSQFHAYTKSYLTFQNLFYFLNISYNTVGAVAANVGYRAIKRPRLGGTADILFLVSSGLATVAPLASSAAEAIVRKHTYSVLEKKLGKGKFDTAKFADELKELEALSQGVDSPSIGMLPATQRLALYTKSNQLFYKQLDSETQRLRKLQRVMLQTTMFGPPIGGTSLCQAILATHGFYRYSQAPKKQLRLNYYGSMIGTIGASASVSGTAAWLVASLIYEHRLAKQKRLPTQLIEERLDHLDRVEKLIRAI